MTLPRYSPQEYALDAVLYPDPDSIGPKKEAEHHRPDVLDRTVHRPLPRRYEPAPGSILADTVFGFAIIAASDRPATYVVPSDPDFVRILSDPSTYGVEYLLAAADRTGVSDALNQRYPTLYDTGADIATLELEIPNDGDGQPNWRLYRVNEPVPQP